MTYTIKSNNGHGDWKSSCRSVTVHDEDNQIVAWYAWRRIYRRTEAEATFLNEKTRKKDVHYFPPANFFGNLYSWFLSECQARYGIVIPNTTEQVTSERHPEPIPAL
jgi:hypothetical protein